jgi:hypothetical protein
MKASRFSDAQKAFILKQGNDGIAVADHGQQSEPERHDECGRSPEAVAPRRSAQVCTR